MLFGTRDFYLRTRVYDPVANPNVTVYPFRLSNGVLTDTILMQNYREIHLKMNPREEVIDIVFDNYAHQLGGVQQYASPSANFNFKVWDSSVVYLDCSGQTDAQSAFVNVDEVEEGESFEIVVMNSDVDEVTVITNSGTVSLNGQNFVANITADNYSHLKYTRLPNGNFRVIFL